MRISEVAEELQAIVEGACDDEMRGTLERAVHVLKNCRYVGQECLCGCGRSVQGQDKPVDGYARPCYQRTRRATEKEAGVEVTTDQEEEDVELVNQGQLHPGDETWNPFIKEWQKVLVSPEGVCRPKENEEFALHWRRCRREVEE